MARQKMTVTDTNEHMTEDGGTRKQVTLRGPDHNCKDQYKVGVDDGKDRIDLHVSTIGSGNASVFKIGKEFWLDLKAVEE